MTPHTITRPDDPPRQETALLREGLGLLAAGVDARALPREVLAAIRRHAVRRLTRGTVTVSALSKELKVSRESLHSWLRWAREGGQKALAPRPQRSTGKVTAAARHKLLQALRHQPEEVGLDGSLWSLRLATAYLDSLGLSVSRAAVRWQLVQHGPLPARPIPGPRQQAETAPWWWSTSGRALRERAATEQIPLYFVHVEPAVDYRCLLFWVWRYAKGTPEYFTVIEDTPAAYACFLERLVAAQNAALVYAVAPPVTTIAGRGLCQASTARRDVVVAPLPTSPSEELRTAASHYTEARTRQQQLHELKKQLESTTATARIAHTQVRQKVARLIGQAYQLGAEAEVLSQVTLWSRGRIHQVIKRRGKEEPVRGQPSRVLPELLLQLGGAARDCRIAECEERERREAAAASAEACSQARALMRHAALRRDDVIRACRAMELVPVEQIAALAEVKPSRVYTLGTGTRSLSVQRPRRSRLDTAMATWRAAEASVRQARGSRAALRKKLDEYRRDEQAALIARDEAIRSCHDAGVLGTTIATHAGLTSSAALSRLVHGELGGVSVGDPAAKALARLRDAAGHLLELRLAIQQVREQTQQVEHGLAAQVAELTRSKRERDERLLAELRRGRSIASLARQSGLDAKTIRVAVALLVTWGR